MVREKDYPVEVVELKGKNSIAYVTTLSLIEVYLDVYRHRYRLLMGA